MITKEVNDLIQEDQPLYKISAQRKSCKIGIVVGKMGKTYNYMLLAKFDDGTTEWVTHLNGIENDKTDEPGWYVIA